MFEKLLLFHESSLGFNDMIMVCLSLVSSVHCRVICGDLSRLSCYFGVLNMKTAGIVVLWYFCPCLDNKVYSLNSIQFHGFMGIKLINGKILCLEVIAYLVAQEI